MIMQLAVDSDWTCSMSCSSQGFVHSGRESLNDVDNCGINCSSHPPGSGNYGAGGRVVSHPSLWSKIF